MLVVALSRISPPIVLQIAPGAEKVQPDHQQPASPAVSTAGKELGQAFRRSPRPAQTQGCAFLLCIWRRMLPQSRSTVKSSIAMLRPQKKTMRRMPLLRPVWLSRSSRTAMSSSRAAMRSRAARSASYCVWVISSRLLMRIYWVLSQTRPGFSVPEAL